MNLRIPHSQPSVFESSPSFVLAYDYVNYRLLNQGFEWCGCPQLPPIGKVALALRALAERFEHDHIKELQAMIDSLALRPGTAYPTFMHVAATLFETGINWGRIIAMYAFGGALAIKCLNDDEPELIASVASFVGIFAEARLDKWISENGGWVSE